MARIAQTTKPKDFVPMIRGIKPEVRKKLEEKAAAEKRTLTDYIRLKLERIAVE